MRRKSLLLVVYCLLCLARSLLVILTMSAEGSVLVVFLSRSGECLCPVSPPGSSVPSKHIALASSSQSSAPSQTLLSATLSTATTSSSSQDSLPCLPALFTFPRSPLCIHFQEFPYQNEEKERDSPQTRDLDVTRLRAMPLRYICPKLWIRNERMTDLVETLTSDISVRSEMR